MTELNPGAVEVLQFWFGRTDRADEVDGALQKRWFFKDPKFDNQIRQRFAELLEPARDGQLNWSVTPFGRLAEILLLDQFPRNIFRNQPEAFAYDATALQLALAGLEMGDDRACGLYQRLFFYLPLEHSEELPLQQRSVALFEGLLQEAPAAKEKQFSEVLDYAVRHRDIIARFGRFPHRNHALGREPTAEELEFLRQPGSSF